MILVTGAIGYVGGSVVSRLATDSHSVAATVRTPGAVTRCVAAGVPARLADYEERAALIRAFAGVDVPVLVSSDEHAVDIARLGGRLGRAAP